MLTLCEFGNWCARLGKITDDVVANVKDCSWGQVDLSARSHLFSGSNNFVETSCWQLDAIDCQCCGVSLDEVDNDLRLLENLITLTRRNLFDCFRKICRIAPREPCAHADNEHHEPSRNTNTDDEQFVVNFFHCSILADFVDGSRVLGQ